MPARLLPVSWMHHQNGSLGFPCLRSCFFFACAVRTWAGRMCMQRPRQTFSNRQHVRCRRSMCKRDRVACVALHGRTRCMITFTPKSGASRRCCGMHVRTIIRCHQGTTPATARSHAHNTRIRGGAYHGPPAKVIQAHVGLRGLKERPSQNSRRARTRVRRHVTRTHAI